MGGENLISKMNELSSKKYGLIESTIQISYENEVKHRMTLDNEFFRTSRIAPRIQTGQEAKLRNISLLIMINQGVPFESLINDSNS